MMNEVIYKIESEGVNSAWKEDEQRKGEESGSDPELNLGEVQRIWQTQLPLPCVEEIEKSFVSTEGDTMASNRPSARNSYYGSPYLMVPMQHFSFNNSFTYGS